MSEGSAIVTHNTLSADATHVQVFYPFHPLHGYRLRVKLSEEAVFRQTKRLSR
jgi:hypothetical protein